MNVLMMSPGFPAEMPFFTRGLARVGANAIGIGDQAQSALPELARESLSAYFQVPSFTEEDAIFRQVEAIHQKARLDRIECLWEPFMILAAQPSSECTRADACNQQILCDSISSPLEQRFVA